MTEYRITWTIDIDAESPEDAARQALAIHRDPESIATVFEIEGPDGTTTVDLEERIVHDQWVLHRDPDDPLGLPVYAGESGDAERHLITGDYAVTNDDGDDLVLHVRHGQRPWLTR